MHLEVGAIAFQEMNDERKGESSGVIKIRVDRSRKVQEERYCNDVSIHCNAQMGPMKIEKYCQLDSSSLQLLQRSVEKLGLSARAYHRILKIARTIADMEERENIELSHVAEAVQYRRNG